MGKRRALVAVVDDDESVRESLPDALSRLGYSSVAFASAEQFLAFDRVPDVRCLILDINMPGMSGPQLLGELHRRGYAIPTVFITAQSPDSVDERDVICLFKPFTKVELRDALDAALARK